MSKLPLAIASLFLLASFGASAETEFTKRAYVVAVDGKAKTIRFRYKEEGAAKEATATWDDKTEWEDSTTGRDTPATAALAGQLKKDSKVFIDFTDRSTDGQQWWVVKVSAMPASFEVK